MTSFACPTCGSVHAHQSDRYRNHVCAACASRATCTHGRSVVGFNTGPFGGFAARHDDQHGDECHQVTTDGRVWVDGREFQMREARFGGVVTVQLWRLTSVSQTAVWSRTDGVEWTSAGVPEPHAGFVAPLARRRRWLRPASVRWEWMVRDTTRREVVGRGVTDTAGEARAAVVAELDRLCRDSTAYV